VERPENASMSPPDRAFCDEVNVPAKMWWSYVTG
jgi:hypothetical protein